VNFKKTELDGACLRSAEKDTGTTFCRGVLSSPVTMDDFKSHWEFGRRPRRASAIQICNLKGVSLKKFRDHGFTREFFLTTAKISPMGKPYKFYCNLNLTEAAGLVKETGNDHYNFYKCDEFTLDMVEVKEYRALND
jgi:hypothetical protein